MRRKPKAKLYLRFRTPDGKQSPYCPALFDHKSRIRPFWCLVKGVEELHRDGTYYRRAKRDGKWKWESLGSDANAAYTKLDVPPLIPVKPAGENEAAAPTVKDGFRIDDEIAVYLSNVSKLSHKTYKAYTRSLELFRQSCKKIYVHQITKQDLQAFDTALIEVGNEDRTRHNRVQHVVTFLRNEEGRRPGPPIKDVSIKVKYVEAPPEAYTRQELEDLFRVSDEDEKFLWRFFLGTGFRETEVSVAEITDVNRDTKTIRVDEKHYFGFKPKDCEKRNVPIPDTLIAEALARTGFQHVTLIDFDTVEELNLDRLLHAYPRDARLARSKVQVLGKAIKRNATASGFNVEMIEHSIVEEQGFRAALDCDVLFSCVDRPWPRSILNYIAYAHLIPVIDGGILVSASKTKGLHAADWRAHIASAGRRCLECREQYDPGLVSTERDGYFDDPRYIEGLSDDHFIKRNENVFAFSMSTASFEMLQLLMMVLAPLGVADAGAQMYHFVPGLFDRPNFDPCKPRCPFSSLLLSKGDSSGITVTGPHSVAERRRADRTRLQAKLPWRTRLVDWLQEKLNAHAVRWDVF